MNSNDIKEGMTALVGMDIDIAESFDVIGAPPPRYSENNFLSLISIVVSQQISRGAANSILSNIQALIPDLTANHILAMEDQSLRNTGLSGRKVEYVKGLASAIIDGRIDIEELEKMSDEEVIKAITGLRGFGRWSAEIYLIVSLNRKDVFPANDLALQSALGRLKKAKTKPDEKKAREMTRHWSPHRSIAALFLWHYYRNG